MMAVGGPCSDANVATELWGTWGTRGNLWIGMSNACGFAHHCGINLGIRVLPERAYGGPGFLTLSQVAIIVVHHQQRGNDPHG